MALFSSFLRVTYNYGPILLSVGKFTPAVYMIKYICIMIIYTCQKIIDLFIDWMWHLNFVKTWNKMRLNRGVRFEPFNFMILNDSCAWKMIYILDFFFLFLVFCRKACVVLSRCKWIFIEFVGIQLYIIKN